MNITADPSDQGAPDLADRAWDPLWDVCEELELPVHFHIGNSDTTMSFYEKYMWASQTEHMQWAIGGTMLFIGNARSIVNIICSGMLERHPTLQIVSVESGAGWVLFVLEALEYEMPRTRRPISHRCRSRRSSTSAPDLRHHVVRAARSPDLVERLGDRSCSRATSAPDLPYPDPLKNASRTCAQRIRGREDLAVTPVGCTSWEDDGASTDFVTAAW